MEHPENNAEAKVESLAHKYQSLRCWILNAVVSGEICTVEDWRELQAQAQKVLQDTE